MVVTDLDDTLLRKDLSVSDHTIRTFAKACENGIITVLASGRMYASMLPYVKTLGISAPVIACNGAEIIDPASGLPIYECPLNFELARDMAAFANSLGLFVQVYYGDKYFYNKHDSKWPEFYKNTSGVVGEFVPDIVSFIDKPTPKLLIIDEPENIPGLLADFKNRFSHIAEVAMSKPMYLELTHKDATKRNACAVLADKFSLRPENIMCCGDGLNDLAMIEWAGFGVCVENARDNIRRAADFIAPSPDDDGIAETILKFCDLRV